MIAMNVLGVLQQAERAAIAAVNNVTLAAAEHARSTHDWDSRTGMEERSIRMLPAVYKRGWARGGFGAPSIPTLFLEFGTVNMAARPFMRPAGDAQFARLSERFREEMHDAA